MVTKTRNHLSLRALIVATAFFFIFGCLFTSCASKRTLSMEEFREEYDPSQDGYNYWEDSDDYYYEYMGY